MRITVRGKTYYSEFKITEDNFRKFKTFSIKEEQLEPFKKAVKRNRNFLKSINQNGSR